MKYLFSFFFLIVLSLSPFIVNAQSSDSTSSVDSVIVEVDTKNDDKILYIWLAVLVAVSTALTPYTLYQVLKKNKK